MCDIKISMLVSIHNSVMKEGRAYDVEPLSLNNPILPNCLFEKWIGPIHCSRSTSILKYLH
ncbi:unnamed protein product [Prunus brigantina]